MDTKNAASTPARTDNRLTVLVFKDGFASRTFQIPLGWFSRLGLAVGLLAAASTFLAIFALKSYYAAHRTSPERVESLEGELSDLRASYRLLEAKTSVKAPEAIATPQAQVAAAPPAPIPTVTVTVTPVAAAAPPAVVRASKSLLFSALPVDTQPPPANTAQIPIEIHSPRASWRGSTLVVQFDLQYERQDKGNQQGRIVVLARGPQTILGYPDGVLNLSTHDTLLVPERGEYFSVSRFRAVKAEFASVSKDAIREAEVIIFDGNQNLLIHTRIEPSQAPQTEDTPAESANPPEEQPAAQTESAPAAPQAAPPESAPATQTQTQTQEAPTQ